MLLPYPALSSQVAKGNMSAEQLLAPPHAVGDPAATLTAPQLTNQVRYWVESLSAVISVPLHLKYETQYNLCCFTTRGLTCSAQACLYITSISHKQDLSCTCLGLFVRHTRIMPWRCPNLSGLQKKPAA